jgi:alkaline phosphatase D
MKVAYPTLGPIIGYTTATETRIWLRGEFEKQGDTAQRCFGVVQYRLLGTNSWSAPIFNKLEPHFDMTGVFALSGLNEHTRYEYRAGWFFADEELDSVKKFVEDQLDWHPQFSSFVSAAAPGAAQRSYVVGSCRYLLRLFGGAVFDDRGDKTFQTIARQISQGYGVDALLMIGDQIYADDLSFFGQDEKIDQFLKRYRTVFGQQGIRELMGKVPTYMILDDHEIEDNWPSKASTKDRLTTYPNAIHAYQIYQCSHGPLFKATPDGRISGTLTHFWYQFSDGCADWFVMDARTERSLSKGAVQMIKDTQLNALLAWLNDGSGRIKFVVSSVPFIPDLTNDKDDKWGNFIAQRDTIISHIINHHIPNVVFVSGDVHCSFSCQVDLGAGLYIRQIVSSSFFWPYPHMDGGDFCFDKFLNTETGGQWKVNTPTAIYSEDNFVRIEANPARIDVEYFSRKGDSLGKDNVL